MMLLQSSLMIRRICSYTVCSSSSSINPTSNKKRLVFLGSPQVSASVLDTLFNASATPDSLFEVTAIVTQPPSRRDRGKKLMPSPVAQHALDRGFPSDLIFTPLKAGEEAFLYSFKSLEPELCVTAAYGNILPTKFLNIPSKGTVNIHPSLLPQYRGAAPVQRALQDGVKETGVSLAYTVHQLDAGPVIARESVTVDDQIKAPDLLGLLFALGSKLLIHELPSIFDGSAMGRAEEQDDSKATLAPKQQREVLIMLSISANLPGYTPQYCVPSLRKVLSSGLHYKHFNFRGQDQCPCINSCSTMITPEESWLCFDEDAQVLHNKVRAFAGWPGTRARLMVIDPSSGQNSFIELKIITTRIYGGIGSQDIEEAYDVLFTEGSLIIPCGGGTALEVLEVQLPGKRAVNAAAFWNGLRGHVLRRL